MVIDKHADGWIAIKEYLENSLQEMRVNNDSSALNKEETAKLRGRIEYAKEMLALEESPEKTPGVDGPGYNY